MYHVTALLSVYAIAKYVRTAADVLVGVGSALFSALSAASNGQPEQSGEIFGRVFKEQAGYISHCYSGRADPYTAGEGLTKWWPKFGGCLELDGGVGVQLAGVLSLALTTIVIGGIPGGLLFGIYWVSTTAIFGMHMDAFGALGMKDFKTFLRMRFDKNGALAIYAIDLQRVPGPKGWRGPTSDSEPQVVPKKPLRPHLIEKIVIAAARPAATAVSIGS